MSQAPPRFTATVPRHGSMKKFLSAAFLKEHYVSLFRMAGMFQMTKH
jgi:hypothetical protein